MREVNNGLFLKRLGIRARKHLPIYSIDGQFVVFSIKSN